MHLGANRCIAFPMGSYSYFHGQLAPSEFLASIQLAPLYNDHLVRHDELADISQWPPAEGKLDALDSSKSQAFALTTMASFWLPLASQTIDCYLKTRNCSKA